jgi:ATP-dependent RNA helicase DeaD
MKMNKFEKLGLSPEVVSILSKTGITEPTEIQEKTIPLALAGHDIIGGSATGSGKTLAFTSALIEKIIPKEYIQALILTPTRELAEQVANAIKKFSKNKKINVLAIYGGVDIQKQIKKIGQTDILVGTPGRILDHLNRRTLRTHKINYLILDEVDRMFDMGFQKDVEKIIKEIPKQRQTMLFSATVSADIDHLTKKHTKNAKEISVQSNVDPTKLKQIYYDVPSNKKFSLLIYLLKQEKEHLTMVFCSTRRNADFVAKNLQKLGIRAKAIHGGLVQNKRTRIIEEFQKKEINVLICTDVAARGLDIKGVSHVYNYDLPRETKDYIHRIGRTARAGEQGIAINILSNRDYENFSNIVNRENITITPVELPKFEKVMIQMNSQKDFRFNPRNQSRRNHQDRGNNSGRNFNKRTSNKTSRNNSSSQKRFNQRSRFGNNKNRPQQVNRNSNNENDRDKSFRPNNKPNSNYKKKIERYNPKKENSRENNRDYNSKRENFRENNNKRNNSRRNNKPRQNGNIQRRRY